METLELWKQLTDWKQSCVWVDLSHELSVETPHWEGYPIVEVKTFADFDTTVFQAHTYTFVGQYGTHMDAPAHFVEGAATVDTIAPKNMVMPLCVIDLSKKVAENNDYMMIVQDILDWENKYGRVPEGSFVAFRSDWSKRGDMTAMENRDKNGNKHYPGWSVDALRFLVEERNIGSIGHEPFDTDPAVVSSVNGFVAEHYILSQNRMQIELLKDLYKCPPVGALIFCTFQKVKNASGFPTRCFAICPKQN